MVSSVSNSLGSAAYLKSAQSGGNAQQTRQQQAPKDSVPADTSAPVRAPEKAERPEETTNDNRKKADTQLEERNDDQTLQTESQRGSLLDIAV